MRINSMLKTIRSDRDLTELTGFSIIFTVMFMTLAFDTSIGDFALVSLLIFAAIIQYVYNLTARF